MQQRNVLVCLFLTHGPQNSDITTKFTQYKLHPMRRPAWHGYIDVGHERFLLQIHEVKLNEVKC